MQLDLLMTAAYEQGFKDLVDKHVLSIRLLIRYSIRSRYTARKTRAFNLGHWWYKRTDEEQIQKFEKFR